MSNKPYGYVMKFESGIEAFNAEEYELPSDKRISSIPLYTHPVKELTISNNEIHKEFLKLIKNCDSKLSIGDVGFPALIEDFARAILEKAQER